MNPDIENSVAIELDLEEVGPFPPDMTFGRLTNELNRSDTNKRHTMIIPGTLFAHLQYLADQEQTNVQHLIRQFIKLGIIIRRSSEIDPNAELYLHMNGEQTKLVLL